ncbi:MAG: hypothetical protein C5B52_17660 [Bacteroidetes bacterium]|nr:MAG: hypothetical protein C5B52_17660 [Bacteroidota bacterium]
MRIFLIVALGILLGNQSYSQKPSGGANPQEVADKLSNPVASMISVPFQNNIDYGIGSHNGSKYTLNFQPVIPIKLSENWNLITRYIIPIIDQRDITGENTSQFGLSDATISGFFSPKPKPGGIIWGAGPAFLVPIGTSDYLSTKKWGVGPTALVLRQSNGLTYGFLANQIWSFAGSENHPDVNQLFLQPFFAKNFKSGAGLGLNAEITQNWEASTTLGFINPTISGVTKLGSQIVSLFVGPRIPFTGPSASRPDWGLRAVLTLVFAQ